MLDLLLFPILAACEYELNFNIIEDEEKDASLVKTILIPTIVLVFFIFYGIRMQKEAKANIPYNNEEEDENLEPNCPVMFDSD